MHVDVAHTMMIGLAALAVAVPAGAQQAPVQVTFAVPLNLTRLQSSIPKVKVSCELHSSALVQSVSNPVSRPDRRTIELEIPVSQGDVVQTAQLVITLQPQELDSPSGKQASYACNLSAFDAAHQAWVAFDSRGGAQVFLMPAPAPVTGAFVW